MNAKESEMKGRREERNVLDELLDHPEDDDLDVELIKGFKKSRGMKIKLLTAPSTADQHGSRFKQGNGSNGNGKQQTAVAAVRAESVGSEYSTHSGSCSCENHSSRSSRSPSPPSPPPPPRGHSPTASNSSYQSFTRSPSLKIKIHSNSDSRTVKSLNSPPPELGSTHTKRRHTDEGDDVRSKKRKKSSKKRDYNSLLKYFFKDSCYFVMKSNNEENIHISKRERVWATPNSNEIKLNSAFNEFRNVILIFSVKESGKFQGFARLSSLANYDCEPVNWSLPPGVKKCPFGGLFYVDWINRNELSFTNTTHLFNSFNDGKPVKIGRDGQEVDPQVGEELCRLFPPDDTVDLIPLLKRMKNQTQKRPKKRHARGPFFESDSHRSGASSHDYRVRSHSSSEAYSNRKRLSSNNDAHLTRHHSSRNIRDDRDYSNSDRNRYSTRRHDPTNGHYRLHQGSSYDLHYDPYRRMPSRHESSSHSRPERRTRDDRRYYY